MKEDLEVREKMLIGMNEIIRHFNNEDALEPWLMCGVPDDADEEEIRHMADDFKTFEECTSLFLRMMKRKSAYEDGLYIDGRVITANPITEAEA